MDDSPPTSGVDAYIEITVRIPDELVRHLGAAGDVERRTLEALALDEYRLGHLNRDELGRLLGFADSTTLDGFLAAHAGRGEPGRDDTTTPDEAGRDRARQAAANIIARRKGVTLGGLTIKDLINEGRP